MNRVAGGLPRSFWVLWAGMLVNRAGSFVVGVRIDRSGSISYDKHVRIRPGWTNRRWGLDLTAFLTAGRTLEGMDTPAISGNVDLSVGTAAGTFGVHDAIAMFTVTAQSDATGTGTIQIVAQPESGEEIPLDDVPVDVLD